MKEDTFLGLVGTGVLLIGAVIIGQAITAYKDRRKIERIADRVQDCLK